MGPNSEEIKAQKIVMDGIKQAKAAGVSRLDIDLATLELAITGLIVREYWSRIPSKS